MVAVAGMAAVTRADAGVCEQGLDTGLQCLLIISRLQGLAADEGVLRHEFDRSPFTTLRILLAAKRLGMTGRVVRQDPRRWAQAPLPAIALEGDGGYCVVAKYSGGAAKKLLIYRPGNSPEAVATEEFQSSWTGELIYLAARGTGARENARFDFSWFIPAVIKYRRVLGEVLLM